MAAEQVLRLLDSFWFETSILTNRNNNQTPSNQDSHNNLEKVIPLDDAKFVLVPTPTLEVRSYSDQNLDSTTCVLLDSPSPNSVLTPQRLRTIPSEREIREFSCEKREEIKIERKERGFGHGRRRVRKGRTTRSLSELEFKELKGFMDLGFVFSEEDKDSRLVSLIPGLQRLGRGEEVEGKGDDYESVAFDKPYLSEAWDVLDQRGTGNDPLMDWRVPVRGNEIDMKDNLRFWAHTVASIVR
ncbi:uncharacterized protein LOC109799625 [Cajanus cajan]|uniref:uncharacterized protein LOC109799625 n=1 Tax=Cajanus cajan TaxID=3821 RepID=UPI00098DA25E|nr:uncharacterized protein LOC109799625 [Cajanus cajan]